MCVFKCLNICSDFNVVWGMWPETHGTRSTSDDVSWPLWPQSLVLVSSQSSSHSLTISTFPGLCNCPDVSSPAFASSQATYANQSRAQMSRLGMGGESWEMFQTHGCDVWWGTTRLPSPSALAVKCAPIQILTPRAAPSCLPKHSYNWSSQLFLISIQRCLMSVRFDPDLSIFPPDNHPSLPPSFLLLPGLLLLTKDCQRSE